MHTPRSWLGISALAGLLALAAGSGAFAQAPQSDDWSGTAPKSFWKFEQFGDTGGIGDVKVNMGQLTMTAGGADIWGGGAMDAGSLLSQTVSGNFRVTIQMLSGLGPPARTDSKAGIMLRASNDPTASYLYIFESPRRQGVLFEGRKDGMTSEGFSGTATNDQPPIYLRMTKIGSIITGSFSHDGVNFTNIVPSVDTSMDMTVANGLPGLAMDPILMGIAMTSHSTDPTMLATATLGPFAATVLNSKITGTVTDAANNPVANAVVNLSNSGGTATTDSKGAYSILTSPGTYDVSVGGELGDLMPPVKGVTISATTAGTANLKALPNVSLASGDTTTAVKWRLLPSAPAGDEGPGKATYDDTIASWSDVMVPSNQTATIAATSDYWYRAHFNLPMSFVGKDLVLYNFDVDDGDLHVYWNGQDLGSYAEPTGGPANPWTLQRFFYVPASVVTATNVLAIHAYQGGGGAGIVSNAPLIHPLGANAGLIAGRVVDEKGNGLGNFPLTIANADKSFSQSIVTAGPVTGHFILTNVPAGAYTITGGNIGYTVSGSLGTVTVAAGKASVVPDIKSGIPPFFENAMPPSQYDDDFKAASLDKKWTDMDIGDSMGGSATANMGVLNQSAGGTDIWNTQDGENFVFQQVKGDFAATVQVLGVPDNQDWEKGGIQARVDTSATSANAINLASPRHAIQNQIRPTNGAASSGIDSGSAIGNNILPVWLKIRRIGTNVAYYWTPDPATGPIHLTSVQSVPDFAGKDLLVGLAATTHMAGVTDSGYSYAHFAVAPLATTPTTGAVCGDLLGKNNVTVSDATVALRIAVGLVMASATNTTGACGHTINVAFATQILHVAVFGGTIAPKTM